jgi:hypothetical protein
VPLLTNRALLYLRTSRDASAISSDGVSIPGGHLNDGRSHMVGRARPVVLRTLCPHGSFTLSLASVMKT